MQDHDPVVIAERRARRAELAEEELLARLREAAETIADLQERVAAAERRARDADRERGELGREAEELRRDLCAAEQREFAEQKRRVETEEELGGALSEAREQAAVLGDAASLADRRADELGRDVTRAEKRAVAAERRVAELEALLETARLPRPGPSTTGPATRAGRSKPGDSSATAGARPIGSPAPQASVGLAAGLDAAARRLRSEIPSPHADDAPEPAPEQPPRGLLTRLRRRR